MARTFLPGRSGEIVTAVQLADRTGIVAASAPPVRVPAPAESRTREYAGPVVPASGSTLRQARRNVLFVCAAGLFLIVGWIGGGTFGHPDTEQVAPVAAGAVNDDDQPSPRQDPLPPVPTSQPPAPPSTPAVAPKPRTTRQASSHPTRTPSSEAPAGPGIATPDPTLRHRTEVLDNASTMMMRDPMIAAIEQFRRMLATWSAARNR
ncbi:MAG TPA: hypothetical protein VFG87_12820 [Amycolatopsis sp.]|nr:hypothetical protein [Amycolatopsis sp.]